MKSLLYGETNAISRKKELVDNLVFMVQKYLKPRSNLSNRHAS
jgi:hypothetical protein